MNACYLLWMRVRVDTIL